MNKQLTFGLLMGLFLSSFSCSDITSLVGSTPTNPFEKRVPILYCSTDIPVYDPLIYDWAEMDIDVSQPIWLLTPQVHLNSAYANSESDMRYLKGKQLVIKNFVEHKLLQQEWVSGLIEMSLPPLSDSTGLNSYVAPLHFAASTQQTVNMSEWQADRRFSDENISGYNLLMIIDGQVGVEKDSDNLNEFSWFLIDNATGKVKLADHFHYDCDARNYDGLDRIMAYASDKMNRLKAQQTTVGLEE